MHLEPSQGGNIEDARANEGVGDRINQIVSTATQMAAMLNQANGMPILPTVQQFEVEVPCLDISHQNEHSARNGQCRAPTVNHHAGNT